MTYITDRKSENELKSGNKDVLLDVIDLKTHYFTRNGIVKAVDGISFSISRGETLGLVGESGCGKTNVALSIARLVSKPGKIVSGSVNFEGVDLLSLSESEMRTVRGRKIGFIFQDPMTSLNPLHKVGDQIAESIRINLGMNRRQALERAAELLDKVGIAKARQRMNDYPYQFSGGMRQRVMIALALAANPILLLADEPTTALDVTIQAQILELIQNLKSEFNTSVPLITHDLGVAAGICDEVAVIYAGQIVEKASVDELFSEPRMPYTRGLLDSLPSLQAIQGELLPTIEGLPPTGLEDLDQCRFSPRCRWSTNSCTHSEPVLSIRSASHYARCFGTEQDGWINEL